MGYDKQEAQDVVLPKAKYDPVHVPSAYVIAQ